MSCGSIRNPPARKRDVGSKVSIYDDNHLLLHLVPHLRLFLLVCHYPYVSRLASLEATMLIVSVLVVRLFRIKRMYSMIIVRHEETYLIVVRIR